MVLRSVNDLAPIDMGALLQVLASVEYNGDPIVGAVLFGTVEVVTTNQNFNQTFTFGIKLRREAVELCGTSSALGSYAVPALVKFGTVLVTDLVRGDVIDCLLANPGGANWLLRANGFVVAVMAG